jgi:hypothetical protein
MAQCNSWRLGTNRGTHRQRAAPAPTAVLTPNRHYIPVTDKRLLWFEGTTARWDGYLEFQRRPEPMLKWFDQHMS